MSESDPIAARAALEMTFAGLDICSEDGLSYSLDDHLRIARLMLQQRQGYFGANVGMDAGVLARALGTPIKYGEAIVAYISQFPIEELGPH